MAPRSGVAEDSMRSAASSSASIAHLPFSGDGPQPSGGDLLGFGGRLADDAGVGEGSVDGCDDGVGLPLADLHPSFVDVQAAVVGQKLPKPVHGALVQLDLAADLLPGAAAVPDPAAAAVARAVRFVAGVE